MHYDQSRSLTRLRGVPARAGAYSGAPTLPAARPARLVTPGACRPVVTGARLAARSRAAIMAELPRPPPSFVSRPFARLRHSDRGRRSALHAGWIQNVVPTMRGRVAAASGTGARGDGDDCRISAGRATGILAPSQLSEGYTGSGRRVAVAFLDLGSTPMHAQERFLNRFDPDGDGT